MRLLVVISALIVGEFVYILVNLVCEILGWMTGACAVMTASGSARGSL